MSQFMEKVATELEKIADYIENKEQTVQNEKEQVELSHKEAEEKKREELLAPVREKLSSMADSDEELEEILKLTPLKALEFMKKGFETFSDNEKVASDWGQIEETKTPSKGNKYAGYRDPIEAFALGD